MALHPEADSAGAVYAADPGLLVAGLAAQDKAMVSRAQGVGPKLAARIVNAVKHGRDRGVAGRDAGRIDALMRLFPVRGPRWLNRRARRVD